MLFANSAHSDFTDLLLWMLSIFQTLLLLQFILTPYVFFIFFSETIIFIVSLSVDYIPDQWISYMV